MQYTYSGPLILSKLIDVSMFDNHPPLALFSLLPK
jgi:hypothetical protein